MRLHLDTDFTWPAPDAPPGNPDDAAAVAMAAGWPGAQLVGLTTVADPDGRRAWLLRRFLECLGHGHVPVAAEGDEATDVMSASIDAGATLVALGPYSNLAALERQRPGRLDGVPAVAMGGWTSAAPAGLPSWGPARDTNVQADPAAALDLFGSGARLTLVPCAAAASAVLRQPQLRRLERSGTLGRTLAEECARHGKRRGHAALAREHAGLPDDLVTFLWDPAACAAAIRWRGVHSRERRLTPAWRDGSLWFRPEAAGRPTTVVSSIDADVTDAWLRAVERAQGMRPAGAGYGIPMSQQPHGEFLEHIEGLQQADIAQRVDKDPEEQRNREDMSDPDNRETGADGT